MEIDETGFVTKFGQFEKRIRKHDADGLRARWECGRWMLTLKEGKKLPPRSLRLLADKYEVVKSEIGHRMNVAKNFATEEAFATAVENHKTWTVIRSAKPVEAATDPAESDQAETEQPTEMPQVEQTEPRRRVSHTPRLRRMVDFLAGVTTADLSVQDLALLAEIAQFVAHHREAAIHRAEDEACDRQPELASVAP